MTVHCADSPTTGSMSTECMQEKVEEPHCVSANPDVAAHKLCCINRYYHPQT